MFALHCGEVISIRDSIAGKDGRFDLKTGVRISGELEMEPAEVLYRAWRQIQSPSLSESKLRALYVQHLGNDLVAMEAFMRIIPSLMTKLV